MVSRKHHHISEASRSHRRRMCKQYRLEKRQAVANYKIAQGCQYRDKHGNRCLFGLGDDLELAIGLQLDHRPGTHKVDDVSSLVSENKPWEAIWAEVAKCDVICANHHHIITERRRLRGVQPPGRVRTEDPNLKLWGGDNDGGW